MNSPNLAREHACFRVLRELGREEVILVGGYAVSAYGPPRFSVDLDLVLASPTVTPVRALLRDREFERVKEWKGLEAFGGRAERWQRGPRGATIAVDLLVDGVSDRVSGASWSFQDLRPRARRRTVRGLDPESVAEPIVADSEALIALKLAAGRRVDLRDVAVLSAGDVNRGAIAALAAPIPHAIVARRARALLAALETEAFRNSLKGVYALDDRAYARYRESARRLSLELLNGLPE